MKNAKKIDVPPNQNLGDPKYVGYEKSWSSEKCHGEQMGFTSNQLLKIVLIIPDE